MGQETPASATPKREVATLDLLRLCAALMVVLCHYLFLSWAEPRGAGGIADIVAWGPHFAALVPAASVGWIGVEIFFVISGFVILMSSEGKTASQFAIGRFLRLFPALLFFATCSLVVVVALGLLPPGTALLRYLRTVILWPKGPWIDGAVWTLICEALFYGIVWLAILLRAQRLIAPASRLILAFNILFWLAVLAADRQMLGHGGVLLANLASSYIGRLSLLTTSCYFLVGIFAYEIVRGGATPERKAALILAVSCGFVSASHIALHEAGVVRFGQSPFAAPIIWLIAMAVAGIGLSIEHRRPPGAVFCRAARRIGMMTYPLYLFHQISGAWLLRQFHAVGMDAALAVTLAVACALALSYLFASLIEPGMRRLLRHAIARIAHATSRLKPAAL